MANRPSPESRDDTTAVDDPQVTAGPPRWVKVFALVALVLLVLLVVMLFVGGNHGPGRHM